MPLYEYLCDACGHRFEKIQRFSDPPIEECPNCGKRQVKKLVSSPAIQFKGSGWYITDYAKKGSAGSESEKSDTSTKASSETASSKPADSTASGSSSSNPSTSTTTPSKDS